MMWLAPALVAVVVALGATGWRYPVADPGSGSAPSGPQPWRVALMVAVAAIQVAALPAAWLWPADGAPRGLLTVAGVIAAAVAGGPVTVAVLRAAEGTTHTPAGGTPLKGGRVIGVLERVLVCVSLVAGWPEGIAIVMAIKALGRYPELRRGDGASERFIIGTLASVLWAVACAGPVLLLG